MEKAVTPDLCVLWAETATSTSMDASYYQLHKLTFTSTLAPI